MKLQFECRNEQCPALIEYRPLGKKDETFECPRCQRQYTCHDTEVLLSGHPIESCSMCGGQEFYIRKNFPQKIGLLIVILAAGISILYLRENAPIAYGVLAAAVVIDLFIYYLIGLVTVCYRCKTHYWGIRRAQQHAWFDLATAEKYR